MLLFALLLLRCCVVLATFGAIWSCTTSSLSGSMLIATIAHKLNVHDAHCMLKAGLRHPWQHFSWQCSDCFCEISLADAIIFLLTDTLATAVEEANLSSVPYYIRRGPLGSNGQLTPLNSLATSIVARIFCISVAATLVLIIIFLRLMPAGRQHCWERPSQCYNLPHSAVNTYIVYVYTYSWTEIPFFLHILSRVKSYWIFPLQFTSQRSSKKPQEFLHANAVLQNSKLFACNCLQFHFLPHSSGQRLKSKL